jgi:hypothetical protein
LFLISAWEVGVFPAQAGTGLGLGTWVTGLV